MYPSLFGLNFVNIAIRLYCCKGLMFYQVYVLKSCGSEAIRTALQNVGKSADHSAVAIKNIKASGLASIA